MQNSSAFQRKILTSSGQQIKGRKNLPLEEFFNSAAQHDLSEDGWGRGEERVEGERSSTAKNPLPLTPCPFVSLSLHCAKKESLTATQRGLSLQMTQATYLYWWLRVRDSSVFSISSFLVDSRSSTKAATERLIGENLSLGLRL